MHENLVIVESPAKAKTIEKFLGDGFVVTWYDQSGTSNDFTNITPTGQPKIVSSGSVILENSLPVVDFGTVAVDGTAIGDSLALSSSRMMDSKAKSKVILLLTDGMNNKGTIDPETAADACAELGIKVYSVGIGKAGKVPYPSMGGMLFGKNYRYNLFDETGLQNISKTTGGKFYRAKSSGVLWENIKDIDKLERSEVELKVYHEFYDRFYALLIAAVSLFFAEIILRSIFYRKIP